MTISYAIPTYKVGQRRFYHGGLEARRLALRMGPGPRRGIQQRHPELVTGKGTVQLRPEEAEAISDDEFRDLARAVLAG